MKILKMLLVSLLLILTNSAYGQRVNLVSRRALLSTVVDDTLMSSAAKVLKPNAGSGGWFLIEPYQFYSMWFTLTKDSTYWTQVGLDTGTVTISYELYTGDAYPTADTTGFYEKGSTSRKTLTTFTASDTSHTKYYQSFHGAGDPEIALAQYARFYSSISGTLPGAVNLKTEFLRQP